MRYLILIFVFLSLLYSCRKSDFIADESQITVSDNGEGIGTTTWTANKTYTIEGFIFVNDGQILTIEPGTIIKFKQGQGAGASALVVARGGKIYANGTADKPIIFTSEEDDLNGSLSLNDRGLWGGLVILGNASLNNTANEAHVEGIPISEPRGIFGGTDDEDNSGSLSYVSIRHAGSILSQGNEINGLTLGGVGRSTEIHHVEVICCADDGIEIFGGTVDMKHICIAYCDDDLIDTELGYRGRIQFGLFVQDSISGDYIAEHSGGLNPVLGIPDANPILANITCVGGGNSANNGLAVFKSNSGGGYFNSIFVNQKHGFYLEYINQTHSSFSQWIENDLFIRNNLFYNIGNDTVTSAFGIYGDLPGATQVENWYSYFNTAMNQFYNPGLLLQNGLINPFPSNDVSSNLYPYQDSFFDGVNYKGGFGGINWLKDWSLFDRTSIIH